MTAARSGLMSMFSPNRTGMNPKLGANWDHAKTSALAPRRKRSAPNVSHEMHSGYFKRPLSNLPLKSSHSTRCFIITISVVLQATIMSTRSNDSGTLFLLRWFMNDLQWWWWVDVDLGVCL